MAGRDHLLKANCRQNQLGSRQPPARARTAPEAHRFRIQIWGIWRTRFFLVRRNLSAQDLQTWTQLGRLSFRISFQAPSREMMNRWEGSFAQPCQQQPRELEIARSKHILQGGTPFHFTRSPDHDVCEAVSNTASCGLLGPLPVSVTGVQGRPRGAEGGAPLL